MVIAAKHVRFAIVGLFCLALPGRAGETDVELPDIPVGKAKLLLVEDFESTPVGEIPRNYTKTGSVGVVDNVAHSGKKSLRIDAATNGPRRITAKNDEFFAALGSRHWGRLYFKVKLPTPTPQGEGNFPVIHSTLVAGSAQSPLAADPIEVRVLDTVMGPKGTFQYIYNVQPAKRPEFGKGSRYNYHYTDEWTLAEWYVDFATQTYRLFINGEEIKDVSFSKGAGNFEKAEIPKVFESLSFGWNNYQKAGEGFVAWIDDIALSKERIGDRGLPKATKNARSHLIQKINDNPDPLRLQMTPAVGELAQTGSEGMRDCLSVIRDNEGMTSIRARQAVAGMTARMFGFDAFAGWCSRDNESAWRSTWEKNGSLDYSEPKQQRVNEVQAWTKWLDEQEKAPYKPLDPDGFQDIEKLFR